MVLTRQSLIPYLFYEQVHLSIFTKIVLQSKKVLFPNGYPGPPPVDPTPEEQVLLREQLEKRLFNLLPCACLFRALSISQRIDINSSPSSTNHVRSKSRRPATNGERHSGSTEFEQMQRTLTLIHIRRNPCCCISRVGVRSSRRRTRNPSRR
jgi:hypothetical protein